MKVIAMFLPQFYQNEQNDTWWGEGYTDWVAVKAANKLFSNHYEPRVPLNDNYYNLLNRETMRWQAELMSRYNIYGMCFYHYWFKDGQQALEKPAENLLKWKDINMPFCFSWANETWARSWSKISDKNSWCLSENQKGKCEDDGVLLEQDYGDEQDWIAHINYLLPFFKDKRYICIQNKPIFLIYKPKLIKCFDKMKRTWNKIAKKNGFDGVYFIATNESKYDLYDAVILQQPGMAISQYYKESTYSEEYPIKKRIDYGELWMHIINADYNCYRNVYVGGVVGYDDTPRRGNNGTSIINASPEIFEKYLKKLIKLNENNGVDMVFLNAWNEWGEGMYLEPDEKYGYRYLEAVKNALETYKDADIENKSDMTKPKNQNTIERYRSYWTIMDKWLSIKEENKGLDLYFKKNNMQNIAIYGMGMLAKHFIKELENTQINIVFGIDRFMGKRSGSIPVYQIGDELPNVDTIIVTATYDFYNIYNKLSDKGIDKIISLDEVLDYVLKY